MKDRPALVTPGGYMLSWQGWPVASAPVLTGGITGKWYQGHIVVVDTHMRVQALEEFVEDEERSEIWSWSHAPDPFMVLEVARRHRWAVDPNFVGSLFGNYYAYTEQFDKNASQTEGPFADVSGDAMAAITSKRWW